VVTYTVIVDAPNPDEKLFPGMTANINIDIQTEEGIVVPMEALQFTPVETRQFTPVETRQFTPVETRHAMPVETRHAMPVETRHATSLQSQPKPSG
jgi:multidrug efflux pump subunit AcrA (membrane-fusion protein)